MPRAIFPGLARQGLRLNPYLQNQFGIVGEIEGSDLVLDDTSLDRMLRRDALSLHPQLRLEEGAEELIAAQMEQQIPSDFDEFRLDPPSKIPVASGYGRLTAIDRARSILAVAGRSDVSKVLAEEILPLMRKDFGARFVTGVSLDAANQQSLIALSKIMLLATSYDLGDTRKRLDRQVLAGILPFSLAIQSFLDAMTRFSPILLTLPISKLGMTWHFQGSGMHQLLSAPANGIISEFMATISPLSRSSHQFVFHGIHGMSEQNIYRFLKYCVVGINRLMRFMHDPRSFLRPDGRVDLMRKVQAYSAVHLLFADVAAINFSTTAHNRISYAMSALDKIANLRVELGHIPNYDEVTAMVDLASLSQAAELKRMLGRCLCAQNYEDLAAILSTVIDCCYQEIHNHLQQQIGTDDAPESERLARVRAQRNLRHGTFLRNQQFETIFMNSDGTVPDTFGSLPLLLLLGFVSDPSAFLTFRPSVSS